MKSPFMRRRNRRKRQLVKLYYIQKELCYWCNEKMIFPKLCSSHEKVPLMMCTYDHLYDKLNIERGKHSGECVNVASCFKCNNKRGNRSVSNLSLVELYERSNRHHKDKFFYEGKWLRAPNINRINIIPLV